MILPFCHIDPEDRIREFLHNPCGNLSEERDKPIIGYRKTSFDQETDIFDKAGRLKYRTKSDGRKQVLTWDSQDRLVHTRSEQNHIYQEGISITYDALGRRLRKKKFLKDTYFLIRMQGQYADGDIGLYYNRHRYYNPHTGGFISQDPLGLIPGPNVYEYAPNIGV